MWDWILDIWDWFITNRVLILIIAGSLLIVLFLVGDRIRDHFVDRLPEKAREKARRILTIVNLLAIFMKLPLLLGRTPGYR
jgi:predicted PurR-regulated permease PerM